MSIRRPVRPNVRELIDSYQLLLLHLLHLQGVKLFPILQQRPRALIPEEQERRERVRVKIEEAHPAPVRSQILQRHEPLTVDILVFEEHETQREISIR